MLSKEAQEREEEELRVRVCRKRKKKIPIAGNKDPYQIGPGKFIKDGAKITLPNFMSLQASFHWTIFQQYSFVCKGEDRYQEIYQDKIIFLLALKFAKGSQPPPPRKKMASPDQMEKSLQLLYSIMSFHTYIVLPNIVISTNYTQKKLFFHEIRIFTTH